MSIYIIIYIALLIFSLFDFSEVKRRIVVLYWITFLMILFVGLRGESGIDSVTYINFFNDNTDTLWDWKGVEKQYAEYGFYYLSVLLKSICDNIDFYFLVISFITLPFLVRVLKSYSLLPIWGFCIYFIRFLPFRDMNQIRQSLAILIVIYALKYLIEGCKYKYVLFVLLASTFHYSVLIVLPFIFFYKKYFSFKNVWWILMFTGVIGLLIGMILKEILLSTGMQFIVTYIDTNDLGIANPMIYYQCIWCLSFFYFESRFANIQKGYYVIRNAYLYSTIILLLSCNLGVIGGRLSTIFATCEVVIIPALVYTIRPRLVAYWSLVIIMSVFFYFNYLKMLEEAEGWNYF